MWSVYVSLSIGHNQELSEIELIMIPFGMWTYGDPRNHVLDGVRDPSHSKGHFCSDIYPTHVRAKSKYGPFVQMYHHGHTYQCGCLSAVLSAAWCHIKLSLKNLHLMWCGVFPNHFGQSCCVAWTLVLQSPLNASEHVWYHLCLFICYLQCFDTVGWAAGRASGL